MYYSRVNGMYTLSIHILHIYEDVLDKERYLISHIKISLAQS